MASYVRDSGMQGSKNTSILDLPNELLLHIWSFIHCWNSEPPSFVKINEEPSINITLSNETDLKSLSLVSKRWRALVLPELFKFCRLELDKSSRWVSLSYSVVSSLKDQTRCLSKHERGVYERLRLMYEGTSIQTSQRNPTTILEIEHINEDDRVFQSLPESIRCWIPSSASTAPFLEFVRVNQLERKIHGLVVFSDQAYPERPSEPLMNKMNAEHEAFWKNLLANLNPSRIVVAAPPTTMAALTDGKIHTEDTWAFGQDIHFLEFRQKWPEAMDTEVYEDPTGTTFRYHHCLHNMRQWNHLLYSEGSFLPAYNTYEFFLKQPPYILYYILSWLDKEAKYSPPKLESISYRGIFPFSSHISNIVGALHQVDRAHNLSHLDISFAPDPASSILDEPERVLRADLNDCWSEFERAWDEVIKRVAKPRARPGLRITCRDYKNETMAKVLDQKFGALSSRGWVKEGESWVKPDIQPLRSDSSSDDAE